MDPWEDQFKPKHYRLPVDAPRRRHLGTLDLEKQGWLLVVAAFPVIYRVCKD